MEVEAYLDVGYVLTVMRWELFTVMLCLLTISQII